MEWVQLGSLAVSKDGFVILHTEEDGKTTMHMPCVGGHIAHVSTFKSLDSAYKGAEHLLSDQPIDW